MQIKEKCNRHGRQYVVTLQSLSVIRYAFSPCGMTTYGQVDARFLGLQYILATKWAEIVHIHDYLRPFTITLLRTEQATGIALSALGCSLFGPGLAKFSESSCDALRPYGYGK
jgi:hypothetical protein